MALQLTLPADNAVHRNTHWRGMELSVYPSRGGRRLGFIFFLIVMSIAL